MASLPTRKLGAYGPQVTAIGYGMMGLSMAYGPAKPDAERLDFLDHIYQSGQRNWDTSISYGDSEDLIGKWFKKTGKRSDIFLATKFGIKRLADGTRFVDNSPGYVAEAIDTSLRRLGTDHVDLWYCHRVKGDVPIETIVSAMAKQQSKGKVRYLGLSEVTADTLRRACKVHHIDAVQMEYSPFTIEIETRGLLQAARELGVAVVAYSPLGRGLLTGRYKGPEDFAADDFRATLPRFSKANWPNNENLVTAIKNLAEKKGCTPGQVCIAWILAQGTDIIPIPGTTSKARYDENMAALDVHISDDENGQLRDAIAKADIVGDRYGPGMQEFLLQDTPLPSKS